MMQEKLAVADKRIVGVKQVLRALEKDGIQTVFLARDADNFLYSRVLAAAEAKGITVVKVDTMKELGGMCAIDVKTAAAGLLR